MLPTPLLKLRLSRIHKGKESISTQDKLMLVTMQQPDLSANFILRMFKISLPKQWTFQHETELDRVYAVQLIDLSEKELIPAYDAHARKHAWYEQCVKYHLDFIHTELTQQQLNHYVRGLEPCLDQDAKIELLAYFQQHYPSSQQAIALAKAYAGAKQYTQAITQYEWAAQHAKQRNESAFYGYIECLLNRNQPDYQPHVSDVEYAIHLLCKIEKPIDQYAHKQMLDQAVTTLLPTVILQTRGKETKLLADVGREINSLGKSLGGLFGGREYRIPYSKEVIANAPQLLTQPAILEGLSQSNSIQAALLRLLSQQDIPVDAETAIASLKNVWQQFQQNTEAFSLLVKSAEKDQWLNVIKQNIPLGQNRTDLGVIDLILAQGILAYLGDVRVDKQHPNRSTLYEQRDAVVLEMTAFATWFQQEILKPYLKLNTEKLNRIQSALLMSDLDEMALAGGLFAYQYELQKRAQDLDIWLQQKLAKDQHFDSVQAAWVALREFAQLHVSAGQEKVQRIQSALANYQSTRLSQIRVTQPNASTEQPQQDASQNLD